MTGRSIFFGRVCSLRLFPLFFFSTIAAWNNGMRARARARAHVRFLVLSGKIFLPVAKKLAGPAANINRAVQSWHRGHPGVRYGRRHCRKLPRANLLARVS